MKGFLKFLKTTVIGGAVFLVPVVVVIFVIGKALQVSNVVAEPLAGLIPLDRIAGVAVANLIAIAVVVLICFLAGLLARNTLASDFVKRSEARLLMRIPGYGLVKGIADSFSGGDSTSSMRPVMMRLDDASQIAFEVERLEDGQVVVYVPGAPDPKSGSVLIVAPDRVEPLPANMLSVMQSLQRVGRGTQELLNQR